MPIAFQYLMKWLNFGSVLSFLKSYNSVGILSVFIKGNSGNENHCDSYKIMD